MNGGMLRVMPKSSFKHIKYSFNSNPSSGLEGPTNIEGGTLKMPLGGVAMVNWNQMPRGFENVLQNGQSCLEVEARPSLGFAYEVSSAVLRTHARTYVSPPQQTTLFSVEFASRPAGWSGDGRE